MKRLTAILIICLALVACDPVASTPVDIYTLQTQGEALQAQGQALQEAAAQALRATAAAQSALVLEATLEGGKAQATQTAQAGQAQATATAQALEIQGTATAQAYQATATAQALQVQATGTAAVIQTATAWPITATPLAATQAAIVRQAEETRRRAQLEAVTIPLQALFWPVFWGVVLVLLALALVLAYRRLMPVLELRLRTFHRGGNDAPIFVFPGLLIDPDKQFGPGLVLTQNGATSTGHAPTPALQAETTARDQAVDLARALPGGVDRRAVLERANALPALSSGGGPKIEVIEAGSASQVGGWLAEVERKLLTEGEEL